MFGGGDASSLYGGLLDPQQKQALAQRGLLGFLAGMAPYMGASRLPVSLGQALAGGAGGMGQAQDEAAMNAMRAKLVGLQGQDLESQLAARKGFTDILPKLLGGQGGTPTPAAVSPAASPDQSPAADNVSDPRGVAPLIQQAAAKYGIDPAVMIRVSRSEGLGTFYGDGGTSGGAMQLHVTPGGKGNAVGDQFKRDTGLDPLDPANEAATIDYAARYASLHGWGAWTGAKRAGITGFTGIGPTPAGAPLLAGGTMDGSPVAAPATRTNSIGERYTYSPDTGWSEPNQPAGPLGGAAAPAGGLSPQGAQAAASSPSPAPGGPGGGAQPSPPLANGIDPRALAAAGAMAQIGKLGDVVKPLETYYYNSPGYLGTAESAKKWAGVAPDLYTAWNKPTELRQGGAIFNPGTGQIVAQNPRLPEGTSLTLGPNGQPQALEVPGAISAIQQTEQAKKVGEGLGETIQQRNAVLKEEYQKNVVEPFNHAQSALQPLTALQNSMANFQTGPTADNKLRLYRAYQDLATTAGVKPDSDLAKWIASGEIIKKEGTQLGFELARTLGSREANMIVQQAIQSNPNIGNSPEGNQTLIALIKQGLQRDVDKRSFVDNWFNRNMTFAGATDAFNKARPVESYVSQVLPYSVKTPAEAQKLPPGTRFTDPTGTVRTVPGAAGG